MKHTVAGSRQARRLGQNDREKNDLREPITEPGKPVVRPMLTWKAADKKRRRHQQSRAQSNRVNVHFSRAPNSREKGFWEKS
jgi:hypothetical protein